jgi:hypothetical protein
VNDETWGAVCDSLKTHPTLGVLDLSTTLMHTRREPPPVAPDVITSRVQALADMIKTNTSICTIRVDSRLSEHESYQESVIPYLESNRFRPRLLAIQTTRPIAYRAKVLGRALFATRTDANSFWMLLSGNTEVAFPSRTMTIAAAANLPTPATYNANVAADGAASTAMSTLTTTATGSLPRVAAAAATSATTPSSAGQKRKECP